MDLCARFHERHRKWRKLVHFKFSALILTLSPRKGNRPAEAQRCRTSRVYGKSKGMAAHPSNTPPAGTYRGRLAPSPTGHLHLGHARTFWTAQQRAIEHGGVLVLRNEDLDLERCQLEFVSSMLEDLRWFGLQWQEGPDCGGPFAPYSQSSRLSGYGSAFVALQEKGVIYPCNCSRNDILEALTAPHQGEEDPIYPGTCRPLTTSGVLLNLNPTRGGKLTSWRFRVPDGEEIQFVDGRLGPQSFVAGRDFGDFVIWRSDGTPSYQLAVVVDDTLMRITEVVRGSDLLLSTARQLLLYRALNYTPPQFYHCPLVMNDKGERLAKRHEALSLRTMRGKDVRPEQIRATPLFK